MKLLLVLVILILSSPNSQVVSQPSTSPATTSVPCPANSVSFNNVCYRAVNTTATWTNAAIDCASQGGNLVSVSDAFVGNFFVKLTEQNFGTPTRFWLGGSSSISNGSWVWIDGSNMTYTNWAIGRPRNIAAYDSIQMHVPNGQWYDTPRETVLPYVCQVPPAETTNPCYDSNWSYLAATNKCYRVITQPDYFSNQQSICYNFDGDLVSIHSSRENFFVGALAAKVFNNTRQELFIGLEYTPGNWSWVDGTPLNWWPNNLTINGNYNYYGLLEAWTATNKFLWDYDVANSIYPAICDSDPSFMKKEKKIVN